MPSQIWRTAGAATSAPNPEFGTMTRTTYSGWSQGANEAKTEVAFLPNIWAVPVLPATQTLLSGKPPNAPAAVPWVTTPASAWRMYASVPPDTGRCLITGGLIRLTTWPVVGETSALPIRGLYSVPPLA